jgi:hypothetical protein
MYSLPQEREMLRLGVHEHNFGVAAPVAVSSACPLFNTDAGD